MLDIKAYCSGSKGNLYIIYNNNTKILLECGVESKKLRGYLMSDGLMITDLQGCIISHHHSDHAMAVDYVSDYIDTYGTREIIKKCKRVKPIKNYQAFTIGSIKIFPLLVEHGNAENHAFIILDKESCIFFGTDFSLMTEKIDNAFDKVYIECNYEQAKLDIALNNQADDLHEKYLRQLATHLSLENCVEHLKHFNLSKCKEIVLIHASSDKWLLNREYALSYIYNTFNIKTTFAKEK